MPFLSEGKEGMDKEGNHPICQGEGETQEALHARGKLPRGSKEMDEEGNNLVCTSDSGGKNDFRENREEEEVGMEDYNSEEEVLKQMEKLKIEEGKRVVEIDDDDIDDADKDFENFMACKILTPKMINGYVFSVIMPRIWGIEGAIKIEKTGANVFICKFRRSRDKIRITKGGPWSYDDAIIVFEEIRANCSAEALDFKEVSFWVHFHKLPRVC